MQDSESGRIACSSFASRVFISLSKFSSARASFHTKCKTRVPVGRINQAPRFPLANVSRLPTPVALFPKLRGGENETERFGFKATLQVPEGSHLGFVALEKGGIELMYQTYSGMKADSKNPLAGVVEKGPSFLFMEVTDIQQTIRALSGADIVRGLQETPYGSKEVVVKEPGGHYVIFAQLPLTK